MFTSSRISFEPTEDWEKALTARLANGNGAAQSDSKSACAAIAEFEEWRASYPCALQSFDDFIGEADGKLVAIFLDYDGTLTPIVSDPDAAVMPEGARRAVHALAQLFPTAIISGRGREKVQAFVGLDELYYAGSHGMDIVGPQAAAAVPSGSEGTGASGTTSCNNCSGSAGTGSSSCLAFQPAAQYGPLMDQVYHQLCEGMVAIPGSSVEHNKFCVSVHFRNCAPEAYPEALAATEAVVSSHGKELLITRGRKVLEVRPRVAWDKGDALAHLLQALGLGDAASVHAVYIGDDRTDEDAFRVLAERGLGAGVLVSSRAKPTAARYTLRDPGEVAALLSRLVAWGRTAANKWHKVGGCTGWSLAPEARLSEAALKQHEEATQPEKLSAAATADSVACTAAALAATMLGGGPSRQGQQSAAGCLGARPPRPPRPPQTRQ